MDLTDIIMAGEKTLASRVVGALRAGGLELSTEEAGALAARRFDQLRELERIEFGGGALATIAEEFSGSPHLCQDVLPEQLATIQQAFYQFRDEIATEVPDAELARAMRDAFDGELSGDADALLSLEPREVAAAIADRAGEDFDVGEYCIVDDEGRSYRMTQDDWERGPFVSRFDRNEWVSDFE